MCVHANSFTASAMGGYVEDAKIWPCWGYACKAAFIKIFRFFALL